MTGERDQAGLDPGHGPEHARRHGSGALRTREPGELHRRHAVGAAAGRSDESIRYLRLHHDESAAQRGACVEQVEDDGDGDVVGQVGHERIGGSRQFAKAQGIRCDDLEVMGPVGLQSRHRVGERLGKDGVDLHRDHVCPRREKTKGEAAQTGAHLEHDVVVAHTREAHDAADGVGIDDEVLAPLLGGADPPAIGDAAQVTGTEQAVGLARHVYHSPKARMALSQRSEHTCSRGSPRVSAIARTVSGTR